MSQTLKAEFYALYRFKKVVEKCAQVASTIHQDGRNLTLPQSAFTEVAASKRIHQAWLTVCADRAKEAQALQIELEAVAEVIDSVAELYGWTDQELATMVGRAAKSVGGAPA